MSLEIKWPRIWQKEDYIISESPEIENERWTNSFVNLFPALKSRNYRLYFSGHAVSVVGTWLQIVAQSWLVLQLTNSAFLIGLVAALSTLPTLFFSLFGGVIVDRYEKRKILIITQSTTAVLALILGFLTLTNQVNVFHVGVVAFLAGVVKAIDNPARQSFMVEMVGREDLPSAIALNSGIFNAARAVGPSVAALLIATVGTAMAFVLNGLSFLGVIVALLNIKVKEKVDDTPFRPLESIKEGLKYSFSHKIIRTLLIFTGITSVFGWSYSTVLPLIAQNKFHEGIEGLGYLYSAVGIGALVSAVFVSAFGNKLSSTLLIIGGNFLFVSSIFLFTFMSSVYPAMFFLFFSGFGLMTQFSTMNSTIQSLVEDNIRGRVMSIYTIMFLGLFPIGNLQVGFFSEHFGSDLTIRIGALIVLMFSAFLFTTRKRLKKVYEKIPVVN